MPVDSRWRRARSLTGFLPRLFSIPLPRTRPFTEMGVSGTPVYAGYVLTPERSSKLVGQEKYRTFADIMANTSIVAAGVRYFLNVIAKPSWSCESENDKPDSKKYCEFVDEVMKDLHTPWSRIVRRAGTYRFHGFNIQEWTAKRRDDGRIGFYDIEARPQWTIWRWEVDERGTVIGAWQRDPLTGRELGLPRGKIMYLVDDTITDSPEGMGLLRHVVEPAERLKDYLDMEQKGFLRDLRGIPIGRAPITDMQNLVSAGLMKDSDRNAALDQMNSFVQLEKKAKDTSILIDSERYTSKTDTGEMVTGEKKWEVELVQGAAPGLADVGKAIQRLNEEMARILGVENMMLGSRSEGSFALATDKSTQLYQLANSVLRDIRLQAQHDILWPLWSLNGWPDESMPQLKTEDVAPKDIEQITRALRDMATAGAVLAPDDEVQNFVRDILGAPHVDLDALARQQQEQQMLQVQTQHAKGGGGGQTTNQEAQQEDKQDARDDKSASGEEDTYTAVKSLISKSQPDILLERALDYDLIRKVLGDKAGDWIDDFVHSDNKRFKNKSKAERIRMALGAYYANKSLNGSEPLHMSFVYEGDKVRPLHRDVHNA